MTTVSFPITLTGDYKDGTVCKASDYRADFEKLRDAVNHMYERHSTFIFTGTEITYQDTAMSYIPAWGDKKTADGGVGAFETDASSRTDAPGSTRKILNVIKIPGWTQGVRVRDMFLTNFSRLPNASLSTWDGRLITYTPDSTNPLKFGIAKATSLSQLTPHEDNWAATDLKTISLNTEAKVRGPFQADGAGSDGSRKPIATDPVFADGTGYYTESSIDGVVEAGEFLVIYAMGRVDMSATTGAVFSGTSIFDLNWHFVVTAVCDAMVPVL